MKQKTFDILVSILIALTWSLQLVGGILGIIYIPGWIDNEFWRYLVCSVLWIFTIGTGLFWIANLLVLVRCVIFEKDLNITNED